MDCLHAKPLCMMNKVQKSAISSGIGRIFFLSALIFILSVSACTADTGKGKKAKGKAHTATGTASLQQQLRNSPQFDAKPLQQKVDSLVVYKSKRLMYVYRKGKSVKTYVVSLGQAPLGKKQCKGDNKTPEGLYTINGRNANSAYHKNLGISYPNEKDRANARLKGFSTGGDVKIHGLPLQARYPEVDYLYGDWTWGCIAVSDDEIDELFVYVVPAAALLILP